MLSFAHKKKLLYIVNSSQASTAQLPPLNWNLTLPEFFITLNCCKFQVALTTPAVQAQVLASSLLIWSYLFPRCRSVCFFSRAFRTRGKSRCTISPFSPERDENSWGWWKPNKKKKIRGKKVRRKITARPGPAGSSREHTKMGWIILSCSSYIDDGD